MSASKHSSAQARRSPVGNRKSKTPGRAKSKPVSNGLHEYVPESAKIGHSASTGKFEVAKMNLNTVRSLDSTVINIMCTVPQVVVYRYEVSSTTWERTSVEGTLFVCEREASPRYGFVVLNKLHSESSMVTITPGMEFRVQELFVLYKNDSESSTYGLCFQEASVSKETGDLLNRLGQSHEDVGNGCSPVPPRRSASAITFSSQRPDQRVNVLEMIETASRSYLGQNFSDGASSPDSLTSEPIQFATSGATTVASSTIEQRSAQHQPTHQATPVTPFTHPVKVPGVKVTSRTNSVSPKKTTHLCKTDPPRLGQIHHAASFDNGFSFTPASAKSTDFSQSLEHSSGIVRKLFAQNEQQNGLLSQSLNYTASSSTPSVPLRAVSLDEVEKQMTAEVSNPSEASIPLPFLNGRPTSEQTVLLQPSMFVSTATSSPIKAHPDSVAQPSSISVQPPTPITSHPHTLGGHDQSFPPIPPLMHSAGMKAAPKESAGRPLSTPSQPPPLSSPSQPPPLSNAQPHRASSEPTSHGRSSIIAQPTLSPLPELMTSRPRSTSPISSTLMSPYQFTGEPTASTKPATDKLLTREELLQAFDHLLKHDENFIDQLHNAYKESLLSKQT